MFNNYEGTKGQTIVYKQEKFPLSLLLKNYRNKYNHFATQK